MRVRVVRTGGLAGLVTSTTADSRALPPETVRALEEMVDSAGITQIPLQPAAPTSHPDRFSFEVTVEKDGLMHEVRVAEEHLPENLRTFIAWLESAPWAERKIGRG